MRIKHRATVYLYGFGLSSIFTHKRRVHLSFTVIVVMVFGYAFLDLDDEQKHARRVLLEYYPVVAQLSVLVIFAIFLVSFFLSWTAGRVLHHERPRSPLFGRRSAERWTWLRTSRQSFRRLRWWMSKPVMRNWGTRGEWIIGGMWTVWLLYLCVVRTGNGNPKATINTRNSRG